MMRTNVRFPPRLASHSESGAVAKNWLAVIGEVTLRRRCFTTTVYNYGTMESPKPRQSHKMESRNHLSMRTPLAAIGNGQNKSISKIETRGKDRM